MYSIQALLNGLGNLASLTYILTCMFGVATGMLLGTIPGLSAVVGVALLIPYTYTMEPTMALIFLTAMFVGGMYGGASTAILFNMPGDSDSAIVALDGHPRALQGKASETLGATVISAGLGGLIGALALSLAAPALTVFATRLGPVEYFSISLLGLTLITGLGGGSPLKGVISGILGLVLSTIGVAPLVGIQRFSFDQSWLMAGFDFIPAVLGAFVLAEVIDRVGQQSYDGEQQMGNVQTSVRLPSIMEMLSAKWTILRSALVGIFVGSLPGAGATVASVIGYGTEVHLSKQPERYGKGELRGVIAPQVASSAASVTTLLPLLVLGIPGGAVAAMLLAVFQIHGIQPGPLLFIITPKLVYTLFAALLVSNVFVVLFGLWEARHIVQLLRVPQRILLPLITMLTVVGAFAANNRISDVWVMCFFGILGYILRKHGYSVPALVLGLILGPIIEPQLLRALLLYQGNPLKFFTRPVGGSLLGLALILLLWVIYSTVRDALRRPHDYASFRVRDI